MNSDEISGLVKDLVNTILTSGAITSYVTGSQAAALATGAGVLATIAYGIWSRWNTRKVPETSIVTALAPSVQIAKASSITSAK